MPVTPPQSKDGTQCIPLHQGYCQPGQCPVDGLISLWGLTLKALAPVYYQGTPSVYANHPWSVPEPEAAGVPRWQTGAKT